MGAKPTKPSIPLQTSRPREVVMKQAYVFDVDGTLTAPRQPIEPVFAKFFLEFARSRPVYLVSGSDLPKLREQLPQEILDACRAVFTCSGAECWEADELVYRRTHQFAPALVSACENFVSQSRYPEKVGKHLEYRTGMLNISAVGRNASVSQRHAYFEWDRRMEERARFVELINISKFPYEASAGGEISIDIVPRGWNKSVVFKQILDDDPSHAVMFFGDRIGQGGNDRPLAKALWAAGDPHRVLPVEAWTETFQALLRELSTDQKEAA